MSNPYYNPSGVPITGSAGLSALVRSEFAAIAVGFALLPALTANTAVVVNGSGTGLTNTVGTLALGVNFSTAGAGGLALTTTGASALTLPTTGTLATLAGAESLSNKTLVAPALGTPASGVLTNCTGLPFAAVTGLGAGVSTYLTTPSTANLAATLDSVTGTGALVLATSPALVTPALGIPSSGVLTNCTGTAAGLTAGNVTTNANLTGPITSMGNATSVNSQTGTGSKFVMDTSPTLVTPNIGAATATTVNGLSITTSTGTLTLANKTLVISNSLTLAGTDSTVMSFPATSATIARTDAGQTFTGVQTFSTPIATGSVATMTAAVGGGVPTPPNNTTSFLRGDGTWAAPPASSGTVSSVSVVTANGVSGTVATATTTPAITLALGAITPTTVNGLTVSTTTGVLTIAVGKTVTISNTLVFAGTDASSISFGGGGTVLYSGGALGTPASGVLSNCTTTTQSIGDNSTNIASTAYADRSGVQTGSVSAFAGTSAPTGYLLCDGSAVSRTTFSALYAIVGIIYGAGDGTTTFNVPNLIGRVIAGVDSGGARLGGGATGGITGTANLGVTGGEQSHSMTLAENAAHAHGAGTFTIPFGTDNAGIFLTASSNQTGNAAIAGTSGSSGSGTGHNNVQPTLVLNYIIKT